ncbi:membrane protein [Photobacterium aquae]|uniref:Membrane protein n=1 Tax=Photobacterium aquae TaxID=1195763 RepID=A0A0J1GPW3_9GAMM|nr:FUSC family protein [Photobacterium aquae]KLV01469.1 membrane protein [Photobacterium aquae]
MNKYQHFALKNYRFLYVFRVFIAFSLIQLIIRLFDIPYGTWALITAVTVMGTIPFIGGVLSKAKQRIWGTVIGALMGLSLYLIPAQYNWLHHLMFLAVTLAAMYCTQKKYAYASLVVAITIVVVAGGGPEDFDAAMWRTVNVLWAGIVSILCSIYVFPSRATDHFFDLVSQFLEKSGEYYHQHNQELSMSTFNPLHTQELAKLLDKQQDLLPHALKEAGPNKQVIANVLLIEKRIYTMIDTLVSTPWDTQKGQQKISDMPCLTQAKEQLARRFERLSRQIERKTITPIHKDEIIILHLLPQRGPHDQDDTSDISYFGYLWLNRELARQFSKLSQSLCKVFQYQAS